MAISANYPTPVYVNGYACNNCAQVAEAKQDINPADPQAGPGGIDAKSNASASQSPAVTFGGALANPSRTSGAAAIQSSSGQAAPIGSSPSGSPSTQGASPTPYTAPGLGQLVNISV